MLQLGWNTLPTNQMKMILMMPDNEVTCAAAVDKAASDKAAGTAYSMMLSTACLPTSQCQIMEMLRGQHQPDSRFFYA